MFTPLRLMVYSPELLLDVEDVVSVRLRLADGGPLDVRPGHAPLVAETVEADVGYVLASQEHAIHLPAGIVWVRPGVVEIYTGGECAAELAAGERPTAQSRLTAALLAEVQAVPRATDDETIESME